MAKKTTSKRRPSASASPNSSRKAVDPAKGTGKKASKRKAAKKTSDDLTTANNQSAKKAPASRKPVSRRPSRSASQTTLVSPHDKSAVEQEVVANRVKLEEQRRRAEEVLQRHRYDIMSRDGVRGVRVDLRMKSGEFVRPLEYVICVDVAVKYHPDHPYFTEDKHAPLSPTIDGIPVDVIQRSYDACNCSSGQEKIVHDQLTGGIAIAPLRKERNWGTLGLVVKAGTEPRLLTNRHVASGQRGREIVQPPFSMGRLPTNEQVVGTVDQASSQTHPFVDAAVIRPNGSRTLDEGVLGLTGVIKEGRRLRPGDQHVTNVFIVGAGSGPNNIREGKVINVNHTISVPAIRVESFENQILVEALDDEAIICPGDSGAILFRKQVVGNTTTNEVVGLAFAAADGGKSLVANHFDNVALELNIFID